MSPRAPVIGIPACLERASFGAWEQPTALMPFTYVEAVQRAGGIALIIPPDPALAEDPAPILDRIDALLLAGGSDIDPAAYGEPAEPATEHTTPQRDALELALTRGALDRDMPVLGICRGLQLINVARGGTLIQHLPDRAGVTPQHRRNPGTFVGNEHEVALEPGSLAAQAAGETVHSTLSHHHQAVDRLGDGLVVSARADDGVIEAIEDPGMGYCLGVQWHPEADAESPVVATLVAEAARRLETASAVARVA
ncbi:MAG TPA: gamma-glutamyl-gamma-aminobutyrate hydrolase family protein [Solirubrobacteraceae bacterium]|nr:gamma-glutamyl-gamma-aminobutyrate hydrolase family protein [Solirubrobacteraceae bacterium]